VAIEREHLPFGRDGLRLHLTRSKTDQDGQGSEVGIPYDAKKESSSPGAASMD